MKKIPKKTWKLLVLTGVLVGMGFSVSPIYDWYVWRSVENLDLENIPSRVTLNHTSISMRCSLNRDFMPQIGSRFPDYPVRSWIYLSSNISTNIFSDLMVKELWLLNGNETWYQSPRDFARIQNSGQDYDYVITETQLKIIVREGPDNDLWGGGTLVDVVVKVEYQSEVYYLQRRDVPITFSH